ncbi:MAG: ABC transporter ATP-binding protein [Canibacter sp.]
MIRTLLSLMPSHSRSTIGLYVSLVVVSVVLRAIAAVLLVPLVAAIFSTTPVEAWKWTGLLAITTLCGWICEWFVSRIGFSIGFGLLDHGQRKVSERLTRVNLAWLNSDNTATARQAIAASSPNLVGVVGYLATPVISAVLLPVVLAFALFPIAWQLSVAAAVGVPLIFGAFFLAGRMSRSADRAATASNTELTERLVEFARTQPALRAARRVSDERSLVGEALEQQHSTVAKQVSQQIPGQLLFTIVTQLALVALAGTTVWLTAIGTLSVPEAIGMVVVIVRFIEPFTSLVELAGGIEASTQTLRHMQAVLEAPTVPDGAETGTPNGTKHAPEIRFAEVNYSYREAEPVLHNLCFTLAPGTTTAIVGPSGSGKSTILSLLAGLYEPNSGEILVDGVPLSALSLEARQALISVVFQDPYLFDGSVRENILAGHPTASDDEVAHAAGLAKVLAASEHLSDGVETRVGEGGGSLSGGERKRVSIARALVKPAPVLLVDEATSSLDHENEAAISAVLTHDAQLRTRVIVAHRLASIQRADQVLFVEAGRVVESGTVQELLAAQSRFAEFWRQQNLSSEWKL